MAVYRYHLRDLRSGLALDALPLENVTFSYELRGVGGLTADLPLYAESLPAARVMDCTIPDRTKLWVERDNALVWSGRVIPPREYDSTTGRLAIAAEETLGAFEQRFLPSLTFVQVDQLTLARNLLETLQADDGGDMGLDVQVATCGVLRDATYSGFDMTSALQALTDLSELAGGFEFATERAWGDTGPVETLLLGYPRLGRARTESDLVLEYNQLATTEGHVSGYTWADGPGLFTRSWTSAESDNGNQMLAQTENHDLITAGYPLLEQNEEFTGLPSYPALQLHADALSMYASGHHAACTVTVKAHPGFQLGDWLTGDDVMLRLSDWRFPPNPTTGAPGFADYMRIVGAEVTPAGEGGGSGSGVETYTLTLADFVEGI